MKKKHGTVVLSFCGPPEEIEKILHHMSDHLSLYIEGLGASNTTIFKCQTSESDAPEACPHLM